GAVYRRMGFDALLYSGVELVGAVAVAALLWWGGGEIGAGGPPFGGLVAFIGDVQRLFLPVPGAPAEDTLMQSATGAAERIFGLLDPPREIVSPAAGYRSGSAAREGDRVAPALELRDVWFRYPPGSQAGAAHDEGSRSDRPAAADGWVLRGLSFRVAAG